MRFCPELSVMKFPSWEYPGIYRESGQPPHATYVSRLAADAGQLQRDVYREIALSLSQQHAAVDEPPRLLVQRLWQSSVSRVRREWAKIGGRSPRTAAGRTGVDFGATGVIEG